MDMLKAGSNPATTHPPMEECVNKCNICGREYELGGRTISGVNFCSASCISIYDGRVQAIWREEYGHMVAIIARRIKKEVTV